MGEEKTDRTCCDDCDMTCAEHRLRWESVRKLEEEVTAMQTATEKRREDIDRRLETGIGRFAALEKTAVIIGGFITLLCGVSLAGYNKAESVEQEIGKHQAVEASTQQILKNIEQRLARIELKIER